MVAYIEERVRQSREEQRKLFGEVGLKRDCQNFCKANGKPFCKVCSFYANRHGKRVVLPCQKEVCYFYNPKELRKEKEVNENQSDA